MSTKNGAAAEKFRQKMEHESDVEATVSPIANISNDDGDNEDLLGRAYEPWLFDAMLAELAEKELGLGFIYTILEATAKRHQLDDIIVVLTNDSFGTQLFRLGGQTVSSEDVARIGSVSGVYCVPDVVPGVECDAVRTTCLLAFSMHLARFSATHDPLTNISNRRSFDTALEVSSARSARYGWAFTLVLIDLNDFKAINDVSGHEFGDNALRQFGYALRQAVRQGDIAARIGGDEFAVILSNAQGHESSGFTERLRGHLKAAGNYVDFSVGNAASPRDSTDPVELKRIADGRLYGNKGSRDA